jgi:glutamine synthetase
VFLGDQLTDVIKSFIEGKDDSSSWRGGAMAPGVSAMAPLARDITDRNRTSPFAFTGNKFEFRAVGSSQSIAPANTALNASVACALDDIVTELEKAKESGIDPVKAAHKILPKYFEEHLPVVFNGNNYAPEWEDEAQKRGLWNLKDTVSALSHYTDPDVQEVFTRFGILSERELHSRQEVLLEKYIKSCMVETKLVKTLGSSWILPVALDSLKKAADLLNSVKTAGGQSTAAQKTYDRFLKLTNDLLEGLDLLDQKTEEADKITDVMKLAETVRDSLLPQLLVIREAVDALELIVDDNRWPLPKYSELLWQ